MRTVVVAVAVLAAAPARADDGLHDAADDAPALRRHAAEPLLHLDALPPPIALGLPETIDVAEQTTVVLGRRTWLRFAGLHETNAIVPERAWAASVRLAHDFGPVALIAHATAGGLDTRVARGTYYDLGLTVGKTARISKWTTAWIGLSVGRRAWTGPPPPGEPERATGVTLSIGGTFR